MLRGVRGGGRDGAHDQSLAHPGREREVSRPVCATGWGLEPPCAWGGKLNRLSCQNRANGGKVPTYPRAPPRRPRATSRPFRIIVGFSRLWGASAVGRPKKCVIATLFGIFFSVLSPGFGPGGVFLKDIAGLGLVANRATIKWGLQPPSQLKPE